jgi:hypothetical protein
MREMTRRPSVDIQRDVDEFGAQFRAEPIPPGTPNRKLLQRAARDAAHARSCEPDHIAIRLALFAELRAARSSENRSRAMRRIWSDPVFVLRQRVYRALNQIGLRREHTSRSGSAYYSDPAGKIRVRVSDHHVPETAERDYSAANGGWSWTSGWEIIIDDRCDEESVAATLDAIRALRDGVD